jgi:hypothetical protein
MPANILKYLNQRYPVGQKKWPLIFYISAFVALFMLVFQPFGLTELADDNKLMIQSGYGLVTFIILILDLIILPAIFRNAFEEENWTVWKEMLFLLWILFTVGLGNFLYSAWTIGFSLALRNVMIFQLFTVAVGIIPIATLILVKQNYLRKKNEISAGAISASIHPYINNNQDIQPIRISSENGKEAVQVMIHDLLYLKSEGNYITVGYITNGKLSKTLLRNTLKNAAGQFSSFPSIYQCHRSWLVNLDRISRVTGNSQGLRVVIDGLDEDIPVARNQIADFKQKLTHS